MALEQFALQGKPIAAIGHGTAGLVPVMDKRIKEELEHILDVYERDNVTAWDMRSDDSYLLRSPAAKEEPRPSQEWFIREAAERDAEIKQLPGEETEGRAG